MYAIAKNEYLQSGQNTTTFQRWCQEAIHEFNFETQGYIIKNLRKEQNLNRRFLSRIEIDTIDPNPIPFTYDILSVNEFRWIKSILPFGIPKNDIAYEFFGEMMENIYNNGATGKIENDNITISMLLALMRKVVYDLGKDNNMTDALEKHLIKILISLYLTTKEFNNRSIKIKSLVDGLIDCADTRDVTQREICIIMTNTQITEDIFDQLMTISLARSMKHFSEDFNKNYTLKEEKYLKGKFGLFFIVPLLKYITQYDDNNIALYQRKLRECYAAFEDGLDLNKCDDNLELTCEILKRMTDIMIDICNINLAHKDTNYFMDKLDKIKQTNIKNINELLVNEDVNDTYKSIIIPYTRAKKDHSCVPIINNDGNKIKIMSSRITKWSSFELNLKNNDIIVIEWDNMINAAKYTSVAPDIKFLSNEDPVINNNKNGSYSPITCEYIYKNMYDNIYHIEKYILLRCINDTIELYTENGKLIFNKKIVVAFKNTKLSIMNIKI